MKISYLIIFPAALFFSSCMTMHGGSGGTHDSHENDHQIDHDGIHIMDDAYHINILKKTDAPLLLLLTITEAEAGTYAENITGYLTVSDSNISSDLIPDIPDKGKYTVLVRIPDDSIENSMFLTLESESGSQHNYEFSFENATTMEDEQNGSNRKFLTTGTILAGSAMVLMMGGKWLIFGGF